MQRTAGPEEPRNTKARQQDFAKDSHASLFPEISRENTAVAVNSTVVTQTPRAVRSESALAMHRFQFSDIEDAIAVQIARWLFSTK
jgi:hypothetical protein